MNEGRQQGNYADPNAMFGSGLQKGYLGNPEVVRTLVAGYCGAIMELLQQRAAGEIAAAACKIEFRKHIDAIAIIFNGQDPAHPPIKGWNGYSLPERLKVELKDYWPKNRTEFGDDAVKVLFSWLCWAIFDAMNMEDPDLTDMKASMAIRQVIQLLMGTAATA